MAKVLIVDIETTPNVAYVWRMWKENISVKQMLQQSYIISFAAKWLGEGNVFYRENRKDNDKAIVRELVRLFDMADIVVAHNGAKFDGPVIMGRALVHGIDPPSPYKWVDTLLVARKEFRFPHNSLEGLGKYMDCDIQKLKHGKFPGFELWLECLRQNDEAWTELKEYNIHDVKALEEIYLKMRPWVRYHPNVAGFDQLDRPACPKCGSTHIQFRGYYHSNTGLKYRRIQCQDCKGWSRERFNDTPKEVKKAMLTNAG